MSVKTSVIYEPRGRAQEYASLAVNLYDGCGHQCIYCYAPSCLRTGRDKFNMPQPRNNILDRLNLSAHKLHLVHETKPVLLCFTCAPYQLIDQKYEISREAIKILHLYSLKAMILTKGGQRAERDFDLLTDSDWFGVTLTNLDDIRSLLWEPGAALPSERISSLYKAHQLGIKTWVSLEPVLYPEITLEIIKQTHGFVDVFKVGMLNHHPHAQNIDWHAFAVRARDLLSDLKCNYYLKNDLRKWI